MRERSEQLEAARAKLQEALQSLVELGPRECQHGDWVMCGTCDYDDTTDVTDAILTEFVLVSNYTRMENGESYLGVHIAPRQTLSHTNGLLHTALYEL